MATGLDVRVRHVAECPEISPPLCAEQELEAHQHDQRILWTRLNPGLAVGLGKGWQVSASLPFDVRALSIDYLTLDGDPYVPPYGDIHHRDEVLWGLVDGRAQGWRYVAVDGWVVGFGLGGTLPFGRTEQDPYALTEQGLEHQHFQLGSGTFDPVASAQLVRSGARWGWWSSVDARAGLYANTKGYQSPSMVDVSVGPTLRAHPKVQLMLAGEGSVETAERWSGTPYGGRGALGSSLGLLGTISETTVLQAQARYTFWQTSGEAEEEPMRQGLVITVGASWTRPAREPDGEHEEEGHEAGEE